MAWALGPAAHDAARTVDIPSGTSRVAAARLLEEGGAVRSRWAFLFLTSLRSTKVRAGEYEILPGEGLRAVAAKVRAGKVMLHAFTVPPGFDVARIARSLEAKGWGNAERFRAAASDATLLEAHGIRAPSAEGYLFPDTYRIPRGIPERDLAGLMLKRFDQVVASTYSAESAASGLTVHQAVTLASIVERETARGDERSMVAAVFRNRMKARMRLESCATIWYALEQTGRVAASEATDAVRQSGAGLPRGSGKLSLADLDVASPFNTYRHAGLPPGPIGNPGIASLTAAAHPDDVPYLFFVSRGDGSHDFAVSYEDFLQEKWSAKRRNRNRK